MLSPAELSEMAKSIAKEGLINPCVRQDGVLLDGRNRMAACERAGVICRFVEYTGDSPVAFIIGANLARRHLGRGQKIALAIEIEPHFAAEAKKRMLTGKRGPEENVPQGRREQSRDQAAKSAGVSGKLVSAAKAIREADPARFERVKEGKLSVEAAKREIKAEQDSRLLTAAQDKVSRGKRSRIESVCDMRVSRCADLFASGVKPDAVITDPPYPREFLPVFSELALAARSVRLVAVMAGQSYLPEVLALLCEHLKYRWTLAYLTPGGQAVQQWQAKVNTSWKPVLLFGEGREWFGDVATSRVNDNDKRFHAWGQSESGMADLVERLTKPGQLICDPFMGGGTTAVVALALGRRFVGCDVDPAAVARAKARVLA